ncbi:hypothetical protein [Microbacterium sp. GXF6406]
MSFIRVRSAKGAAHEFDAPQIEVEQRPELYVVIDPTPVRNARATRYVTGTPSETSKPARPRSTSKPRTKRESNTKEK